MCVWYAMIFPARNLHLVRDFLTSHLGLLEANSPQSTPPQICSGFASQESQAANNSQLEPPREWPAQTTLLRPCRFKSVKPTIATIGPVVSFKTVLLISECFRFLSIHCGRGLVSLFRLFHSQNPRLVLPAARSNPWVWACIQIWMLPNSEQ